MKMSILGDFVRVTGEKHELEEMTKILRNTVLDGSERSRVVCKTASMLSKIVTKAEDNDIDDRFAFKNLSLHFKSIMKDLLPKSFYDIKFKEVESEPTKKVSYVIYNVSKEKNHEIFFIDIPNENSIEPVYHPKDYKDADFIKQDKVDR